MAPDRILCILSRAMVTNFEIHLMTSSVLRQKNVCSLPFLKLCKKKEVLHGIPGMSSLECTPVPEGRTKLAQRFIAGRRCNRRPMSPVGTAEQRTSRHWQGVQSSLRDLDDRFHVILTPPVNWWAIFESLSGTRSMWPKPTSNEGSAITVSASPRIP